MSRLDPRLAAKLRGLEARKAELENDLSDPEVVGDRKRYADATRAFAELGPIVAAWTEYRKVDEDREGAAELMDGGDAEMRQLAQEELGELDTRLQQLEADLKILLLPSDPNDSKNIILEIRAGAGGDESTLFARELFEMYRRYAEGAGLRVKVTDVSQSSVGGYKEIIALIEGDRPYSRLKYESGVHRVQRVPQTETQGRVHTSAVTVAILPEAEDVEVELHDKDLRIDTFCSSGPGGQSVNTTQSAVRIVHLPTNTVVQCQDEKSWHKNKAQALKVLKARIYDRMMREQHDAIAAERKGMVGSGDRSEKIRTYNFPQSRVTDHRIGLTSHNLTNVMSGELGPFVDALMAHEQAERLKTEMVN